MKGSPTSAETEPTAAELNLFIEAAKNSEDGQTDIHLAAKAGNTLAFDYLVEKRGFIPTEKDNNGCTALHWAVAGGHRLTIEHLMSRYGLKPTLTFDGRTLLHTAAEFGQTDMIDFWVTHGLKPDAMDADGWTALYFATTGGHRLTIEHLISRYGLKPTLTLNTGSTLLHIAAEGGHTAIFDFLVAKLGFKADEKTARSGAIALHYAAYTGGAEMITHLVKNYGLNPAEKNKCGETIVDYASRRGHVKFSNELLFRFPALRTSGLGKALWKTRQMEESFAELFSHYKNVPVELVEKTAGFILDREEYTTLPQAQRKYHEENLKKLYKRSTH